MSEGSGFDVNKALDEVKGDRNLSIIAAGAVAVIIGIFLPWYSIDFLGFSTSASPGLGDSTGILLLVFAAGAVATSLNVFKQDKKNMAIATVVLGVLAALIMLNNWPDDGLGEVVSVGIGYWLSLAGSIAMIVGGVMRMQTSKSSASKSHAPKNDAKKE